MLSRKSLILLAAGGSSLMLATGAVAHVSVQGPGFAGQNQVLTISTGHGCEGADTYRLEVDIPAEIVSLRALPGPWGEPEITVDGTGAVTQVAWSKATVRDADDSYYQQHIRVRVPDMPFTTLYFPATQYCRTSEGEELVVPWTALPGEKGEPAAHLTVLPARSPGWNKYTAPAAIDDLSVFDDAQIVWVGDAAYSANPTTMELIAAEDGVEVLAQIGANDELWVKY